MKKYTLAIALFLFMSISVFAEDGHVPIGGKGCPQGQTCLINSEQTEPSEVTVKSFTDFFEYIFEIFE